MHAKVASDLAHVVLASGASVTAGGELLGLQDMFPRMGSQKLQVPEPCHRLTSSPSIGIDLLPAYCQRSGALELLRGSESTDVNKMVPGPE